VKPGIPGFFVGRSDPAPRSVHTVRTDYTDRLAQRRMQ
jgi:hypothetical protein